MDPEPHCRFEPSDQDHLRGCGGLLTGCWVLPFSFAPSAKKTVLTQQQGDLVGMSKSDQDSSLSQEPQQFLIFLQ